jgi:hypothetical protein
MRRYGFQQVVCKERNALEDSRLLSGKPLRYLGATVAAQYFAGQDFLGKHGSLAKIHSIDGAPAAG